MELDDWPCKTRYNADLPNIPSWPRPALLKENTAWRDNTDVIALVEAAVMASRVDVGVSAIDRFADGLTSDDNQRDRILTTAFLSLRDEITLYREMVVYGVMQGVAKARLATSIAAEAKQDGAGNRQTFKEALRIEDDAMDEARFLCRRLGALENKYQVLADALMQHLTESSR
ncbi:MAG: hypothetical protein ACR2RF_06995 [Geminicoccaceae bacterium]